MQLEEVTDIEKTYQWLDKARLSSGYGFQLSGNCCGNLMEHSCSLGNDASGATVTSGTSSIFTPHIQFHVQPFSSFYKGSTGLICDFWRMSLTMHIQFNSRCCVLLYLLVCLGLPPLKGERIPPGLCPVGGHGYDLSNGHLSFVPTPDNNGQQYNTLHLTCFF